VQPLERYQVAGDQTVVDRIRGTSAGRQPAIHSMAETREMEGVGEADDSRQNRANVHVVASGQTQIARVQGGVCLAVEPVTGRASALGPAAAAASASDFQPAADQGVGKTTPPGWNLPPGADQGRSPLEFGEAQRDPIPRQSLQGALDAVPGDVLFQVAVFAPRDAEHLQEWVSRPLEDAAADGGEEALLSTFQLLADHFLPIFGLRGAKVIQEPAGHSAVLCQGSQQRALSNPAIAGLH
jgi:hypothetical protein